ncbi:hypothetical protein LQF76_02840 [Gloeomargaritales cyanobacterium VI4D9]|nr:hypothetical protein LQF76_02840 [Gloeomargaritales cyanobacterium VI4D9]
MSYLVITNLRRTPSAWVYSDYELGVLDEPFVMGTSELIDAIMADQGWHTLKRILIDTEDYPPGEVTVTANLIVSNGGWSTYVCPEYEDHQFSLCPHLFDYFEEAPKKLYVALEGQ